MIGFTADIDWAPEEVINDIMNLTPEQEPGTKYVYSDLSMYFMKEMVEMKIV